MAEMPALGRRFGDDFSMSATWLFLTRWGWSRTRTSRLADDWIG
ncbi:hypothetical protein [Streptomyces mirabilis]|nr:hypothetical protein [Streptomyces mirabilis]